MVRLRLELSHQFVALKLLGRVLALFQLQQPRRRRFAQEIEQRTEEQQRRETSGQHKACFRIMEQIAHKAHG